MFLSRPETFYLAYGKGSHRIYHLSRTFLIVEMQTPDNFSRTTDVTRAIIGTQVIWSPSVCMRQGEGALMHLNKSNRSHAS